jgi:hypothetical protein
MRSEHPATEDQLKILQSDGIPMVVLKDGVWRLVLPHSEVTDESISAKQLIALEQQRSHKFYSFEESLLE